MMAFVARFLFAALISAGFATPSIAQTAFTNVTVAPMDGRGVLVDQTVVVAGDKIISVEPAATATIPDGATIIDGAGKFLIPGFGEMHGHIPPLSQGDQAVNDTLFLYLSNGVTTVRGMLGSEGQLNLREDAKTGVRLSPTLYLAGPSFSGGSISSPAQAASRVERQVEEGWDLIKVHPGLTRAEYDAMATAANARGIDFAGHVPESVGLIHALSSGQRTFDHIDGYVAYLNSLDGPVDDAALRDLARRTKAAGAGVAPTSALWATLLGANSLAALETYPELKYMTQSVLSNWRRRVRERDDAQSRRHIELRRALLKTFQDEGVEILFGTDAPQLFSVPGFSIHHEIAEMAAAGLSNEDILFSGTAAVGAYFKDKDAFGTIAPGQRADLILLDRNPLENLTNLKTPRGVMVRGHWLSREDIDRELAAIAERAAN